ncbi:MAG: Fe2+-dependent dioxygenase [Burkholderiaceae bacterium]|nr:Fe2+-dependent dioxygenase [Roseateles sp.]MBV8469271.1 Fe2+-dependent dioxygenase [Burkholderiaceae bacterium]
MLIHLQKILSGQQVQLVRGKLEAADAPWVDGRVTAGFQGAPVKFNQQIDELSSLAGELGDLILAQLERHPRFISACLPLVVYPPMFNRYGEGMAFGSHVDGSIRIVPGNGRRLRTDISATLFLAEPGEYDGGELQIDDAYGMHSVKLAAGDMVVYPASSLHRVTPVTRGTRMASFFWIQSMVRDDAQRALLFDMDNAIQTLNRTGADESARTALVGNYHNLVRMWGET